MSNTSSDPSANPSTLISNASSAVALLPCVNGIPPLRIPHLIY
jgi:hypothetical protein